MHSENNPSRSFDLKLSVILMLIVSVCFVGYRMSHGGPAANEVACAPGQENVTDCNQQMANEATGNNEARQEREIEGALPK
ncbi:hypothetical protein ASG67_17505 [Sphingomonas sp. Leaf339]|uniref:hypothetical protein n=1 Tax=Sphingomonas sp. Leaf339 TaxID=1736343 RepID=UPI0006F5BDF3|nr:hypothetical protein [Sphingomonas sp. Leaf339]KQU56916.1 hypothetical protein ASG67_17505 [Sphingomonas sp. Leaf339]